MTTPQRRLLEIPDMELTREAIAVLTPLELRQLRKDPSTLTISSQSYSLYSVSSVGAVVGIVGMVAGFFPDGSEIDCIWSVHENTLR